MTFNTITGILLGALSLTACMTVAEVQGEGTEDKGQEVGFADYIHQIPCCYVTLEGLKAYESGFGIEPHTINSYNRRYVLMIDYDTKRLSDNEEKAFRETTGERNGKYLDHDADGWGLILCNRLDGITITSTADFNDIPAGSSLASKIMLFTWSVWPSVKAGKDVGHQNSDLYCQYFYNPIPDFPSYSYMSKQLDLLAQDDLFLISAADRAPVLFMFTERPEIKQHVFYITFTEGEKTWSLQIPADFDV